MGTEVQTSDEPLRMLGWTEVPSWSISSTPRRKPLCFSSPLLSISGAWRHLSDRHWALVAIFMYFPQHYSLGCETCEMWLKRWENICRPAYLPLLPLMDEQCQMVGMAILHPVWPLASLHVPVHSEWSGQRDRVFSHAGCFLSTWLHLPGIRPDRWICNCLKPYCRRMPRSQVPVPESHWGHCIHVGGSTLFPEFEHGNCIENYFLRRGIFGWDLGYPYVHLGAPVMNSDAALHPGLSHCTAQWMWCKAYVCRYADCQCGVWYGERCMERKLPLSSCNHSNRLMDPHGICQEGAPTDSVSISILCIIVVSVVMLKRANKCNLERGLELWMHQITSPCAMYMSVCSPPGISDHVASWLWLSCLVKGHRHPSRSDESH